MTTKAVTEAMLRAGCDVLHATAKDSDTHTVEQVYLAMQSASPPATAKRGADTAPFSMRALEPKPDAPTGDVVSQDEVLIAIKRGEDYADVHPDLVADDFCSSRGRGFEWRVVALDTTLEPKPPVRVEVGFEPRDPFVGTVRIDRPGDVVEDDAIEIIAQILMAHDEAPCEIAHRILAALEPKPDAPPGDVAKTFYYDGYTDGMVQGGLVNFEEDWLKSETREATIGRKCATTLAALQAADPRHDALVERVRELEAKTTELQFLLARYGDRVRMSAASVPSWQREIAAALEGRCAKCGGLHKGDNCLGPESPARPRSALTPTQGEA